MNATMTITKDKSSISGYNLLMISVALIVIGLISVGAIRTYSIYSENTKLSENQLSVSNAVDIIQTYKGINGRYPCPSSLTAARGTVEYGSENCSAAITTNSCSDGVCVVEGRVISGVPARTRIGSIPFRLLQIDEKNTYDAYGMRLIYAVTESQTDITTFNEINGAIDIKDESGQSIVSPQGSAAFVIISNGPNKYGAYNIEGISPITCNYGTSIEASNCIDVSSPPPTPLTFASSLAYLAGGSSQFDDTIEYFSTNTETRWRRTTANPDDIQTISIANVGVGEPNPTVALDVGQNVATAATDGVNATLTGGIRASGNTSGIGGINADMICDYTGTICFQPSDFAGAASLIDCDSTTTNKYIIGLEGSALGDHVKAKCDYVQNACAAGMALYGFDVLGNPKCTSPGTNCPVSTVQICSGGGHNPKSSNEIIVSPTSTTCIGGMGCTNSGAGTNGTTYTIYDPNSYAPNPGRRAFKCNNGVWEKQASYWGLCSCNPAIPSGSTCTTSPTPSATCTGTGSCSGHSTGTSTIHYGFSESGCYWAGVSTTHENCNCPYADGAAATAAGFPMPTTNPCGTSAGSNTTTYFWNNANSVCNWQYSCSCTAPSVTTQTLPTPIPCNTPPPAGPGLTGFSGNAYKIQTFDSAIGQCRWKDTGFDTSGCGCDSSLFSESTTTSCNLSCQNETTPALNWYKYVDTGTGCTKTFDSYTPSSCSNKVFSWQIQSGSTPLKNQPGHGPIKVGDLCNTNCLSNNVAGSSSPCWQEGTGGKFDIYSCRCQED